MNNNAAKITGLIVLVLLAVGTIFLIVTMLYKPTSTDHSKMNMSNSSKTDSNESNTNNPPPATQVESVEIQGFAFSPATLKVKVGTKVTWTNRDSAAHTVTADTGDQSGLKSSSLNQGDTYSATFTKIGTFSYHCDFHPSMKGNIEVTQ